MMPLNFVRGGSCIFRHLQSRTGRVPVITNYARNVYLVANNRFANLSAGNSHTRSILFGSLRNSYATAAGRPKAHTGKAKAKKTPASGDAKKASNPRKKRELTPEQEEKKKENERKAEIRRLKTLVLVPPKKGPTNAYTVAIQDKLPEKIRTYGTLSEAFKAASREAKALSSYEQQKYTAVADENAAKYAAKYEEFIKSHTPLQIKEANAARRKLAKLRGTKARILHDERQVKTPRNAFTFFLTEKGAVKEKFASLAEEWKSASDTEKEKYVKLQEEDKLRYIREYKEAYGVVPGLAKREHSQ